MGTQPFAGGLAIEVQMTPSSVDSTPTLTGWARRDAVLYGVAIVLLQLCDYWQAAGSFWLADLVAPLVGFIVAYGLCYVNHEWGHYWGARWAGARLPLGPYRGVLLGLFDPQQHSRRQFQAMSLGGVVGYVFTAGVVLSIFSLSAGTIIWGGLALGGVAFVVQSLSVDGPIIWRVHRGADVIVTAREGAAPAVILRRTWQSWSLLALLIGLTYALGALD